VALAGQYRLLYATPGRCRRAPRPRVDGLESAAYHRALSRPPKARASSPEKIYRPLFFLGLGAFAVLLALGARRASLVRQLPSIYDASDVFTRARELEEGGDLAGATRELLAVTWVQPQELTGYERLGQIQAAAGDADGELATYERAYAHNPIAPRVNMLLGLAYMRRERFDEAEERLQVALSLEPRNAMMHTAVGDLRLAQKRNEEAIACFERALALDPYESAIHNKAAIAYAYTGAVDRARYHFGRAVELDPQNEEAAGNLQQLLSLLEAKKS
jgi:Flp pilus assembly protein TadD